MLAVGAAVVAVALFGALILDQERRWHRSDRSLSTLFLPDGTPVGASRGPVEPTTPSVVLADGLEAS